MRDSRHDKYDALQEKIDQTHSALISFEAEGEGFQWEIDELRGNLLQSKRYLTKIRARLYCNWRYCQEPEKALSRGEGVPYFEGFLHPNCFAKIPKLQK